MLIRIGTTADPAAPRLPPGVEPAGPRLSPTWRCPRCGTERHFPGPVPAGAAIPCAACGANTVAAVRG